MKKNNKTHLPVPRAGIHAFVTKLGHFARKHRREIAQGTVAAIEIGLLLAPVPGGKIRGAAQLARGLTFLGAGRMWRGLGVAIATPIAAGIAADKLGN